jgi:uncharacterized damage-inducible protein DinB
VDATSVFSELFGRIGPLVREAVEGLEPDQLTTAPRPGANTIGWLVWHLTRVQDDHIAEILETDQLWVTGDWADRFGLPPDPSNSGYGHTPEEVAAVQPDSRDALIGYYEAVDRRTRNMFDQLTADDLDRIVDRRWDPPVTMGVRLVSIADDSLQHAGQAAYLRGLLLD